MPRRPRARDQILDAARRIVESRGAGHLTYEELATESGIIRGGIPHHFPTKRALLKGLIEADFRAREQTSEALDSGAPYSRAAA